MREIGGTLMPDWYVRELAARSLAGIGAHSTYAHRHLNRWWPRVLGACGPASGLRTLFDLIAMPLFALLGWRAAAAVFDTSAARATLRTRRGATAGLLLLPWAARPSAVWRDAWLASAAADSAWCFVLAPPFLSLVHLRGYATRRSIDFRFPQILTPRDFAVFWTTTAAENFDRRGTDGRTPMDDLLAGAERAAGIIRNELQAGVVTAVQALGHVIEGTSAGARVEQALTLVYRILFLRFAESRALLPVDNALYDTSYSVASLCREALRDRTGRGLWDALAATTRLSRRGCRSDHLTISPFNGRLFARAAAPALERRPARRRTPAAVRRDEATRSALITLGTRAAGHGREELNFGDLGVEELGAIYEHILDVDPVLLLQSAARTRREHGRSHSLVRRRTGTFYTPRSLAEFVVRRTLAPLVSGRTPEQILTVRVLDPAMGSGAFLVAACRFLSAAYERALIEQERADPVDFDEATRADIRRRVAERCLAGVDINPIAVQLARLSLWLTTLAQDKPLGFLDHRTRVGNSLVGASPDDLSRLPTARRSPAASLPLFDATASEDALRQILRPLQALTQLRDENVWDVHRKERLWTQVSGTDSPLERWRLAASTWCARWFWPTDDQPPAVAEMRALLDAILRRDTSLPAQHLATRLGVVRTLADEHRFFHWPLEFADVFANEHGAADPAAGFDAVVGNPPWEMLRREPGAPESRDAGHTQLLRFVRDSGLYVDSRQGHLNLYQPFVERSLQLCRRGGHVGLVLPWSAAVDDGSAAIRERLLERCRVRTLVGLENTEGVFPIHRGVRFMAVIATTGGRTEEIHAHLGVRTVDRLERLPTDDAAASEQALRIPMAAIRRIGGPRLRVPFVYGASELAFADRLCGTFPALRAAADIGTTFGRELNATEDRRAFGRHGLPVLDGKHIEPFRCHAVRGTSHIPLDRAMQLLPDARFMQQRVAYRDVSGYGNRHALIAAVVPPGTVTTHTLFCSRAQLSDDHLHLLCALLNSHVLNALARMLMGSHLTTSLVEQLPVPATTGAEARCRRIARLARRLARRDASYVEDVLQAEVALLYGLTGGEYQIVLERCRQLGPDDRTAAMQAWARRRDGENLQSG